MATVQGNEGNDTLEGYNGDLVLGRGGDDRLLAGFSAATLAGEGGNDTVLGGSVADGGPGIDVLELAFLGSDYGVEINAGFVPEGSWNTTIAEYLGPGQPAGSISFHRYVGFERFILSQANDHFVGGTSMIVQGRGGEDLLEAGRNSTMEGNESHDTLIGGSWALGGPGHDSLRGASDYGSAIWGEQDNDTIVALSAGSRLDGGTGDDVLHFNNSSPGVTFQGAIIGGNGNDLFILDAPARNELSFIHEFLNEGADTVVSAGEHRLRPHFEDLVLTRSGIGFGNGQANRITGWTGDDLLQGYGAADTIVGNAGHDTVLGGPGADRLTGDEGNDRLAGDGGGGDNLLVNGGFDRDVPESLVAPESIAGWSFSPGSSAVLDTGLPTYAFTYSVVEGTKMLRFTAPADAAGEVAQTVTGLAAGTRLRLHVWGQATLGTLEVSFGGVLLPLALALDKEIDLTAGMGDGSNTLRFRTGPGGRFYLDDIVLSVIGGGADTLIGGEGNDTLDAGAGADSVDGGAGDDRVILWHGEATANLYFTPLLPEQVTVFDGASVTGVEHFDVTSGLGADTLIGALDADSLAGGAGNDCIMGGPGNDLLRGQAGADTLLDSSGADTLQGGEGNDFLNGGVGALLDGGEGNDTIQGGAGADLSGAGGGDSLYAYGGGGNLSGGDGADTLSSDGFGARYQFTGGSGEDLYVLDRSDRTVPVRAGQTFGEFIGSAQTGFFYDADRWLIRGGSAADTLVGGVLADTLIGGDGADSLDGATGNDSLDGGLGEDRLILSRTGATDPLTLRLLDPTGITRFDGATITGVEHVDVSGGSGGDALLGAAGNDTLRGMGGADSLHGGDGIDVLYGGEGSDTLNGGAGSYNRVDGEGGDDLALIDRGADTIAFSFEASGAGGGSLVRVIAQAGQNRGDYWGIERFNLRAGTGNDTVIGIVGADTLNGLLGDDSLIGLDGADSLVGGGGNDTLVAGPGADTLLGGTGTDRGILDRPWTDFTVTRTAGGDLLLARAGEDKLVAADVEHLRFSNGALGAETRVVAGSPDIFLTALGPSLAAPSEIGTDEDANPATLAVAEGSAAGTLVARITASDPNLPLGDVLAFSLAGEAGPFALAQLDNTSAQLTLAGTLDFEAGPATRQVTLRVTDRAGNAAERVVEIGVIDMPDPPAIATAALVAPENRQAVGTLAGNGFGSAIAWSLEPGGADNALFGLDAASGALAFLAAAGGNFEADAAFDLLVRATTDQGSTTRAVAVTLTDVNEAPVIATAGFTLPENQQAVGIVAASDPDAVPSIRFSLVAGFGDNAVFTINALTGALAFASPAGGDFETAPNLSLRIRAADALDPGLFTERSIGVTVTELPETIAGTAGPDLMPGTPGIDRLNGLGGNDTLLGSVGADTLDGGTGLDTVRFGTTVVLDLARPARSTGEAEGDRYVSVEIFEGSAGHDVLRGNTLDNRLLGRVGNDVLEGAEGADTLDGGAGRDRASGGEGGDWLLGGTGADTLQGEAGADTLSGGAAADLLVGGTEADLFAFGSAAEGADTIQGFASGQDRIELLRAGFAMDPEASAAELLVFGAATPAGRDYALLYDAATGLLSVDLNGEEAGGVLVLASLGALTPLAAGDILLR